jgi:hypothetical protein
MVPPADMNTNELGVLTKGSDRFQEFPRVAYLIEAGTNDCGNLAPLTSSHTSIDTSPTKLSTVVTGVITFP